MGASQLSVVSLGFEGFVGNGTDGTVMRGPSRNDTAIFMRWFGRLRLCREGVFRGRGRCKADPRMLKEAPEDGMPKTGVDIPGVLAGDGAWPGCQWAPQQKDTCQQ